MSLNRTYRGLSIASTLVSVEEYTPNETTPNIGLGIDYTHPLLGGAFGPGHKVIGGYDFVGDDYNGTNTPIADEDPLDQFVPSTLTSLTYSANVS